MQNKMNNKLQEIIHDINEWGENTMPVYQNKNYDKESFLKKGSQTFIGYSMFIMWALYQL